MMIHLAGRLLVRTALILAAIAPAYAETILNAGDTLHIEFSMLNPSCEGGSCDVLMFVPFPDSTDLAMAGGWRIFDGVDFLGAHTGAYVGVFRSEESLYTDGDSTTIDFSAILNGTISGVAEFSLASGQMTWSGEPVVLVNLGRAVSSGIVNASVTEALMVISVTVIPGVPVIVDPVIDPVYVDPFIASVPEPASLGMALMGLLVFGLGALRRQIHT